MTLELLKALATIMETCIYQDSCAKCPIARFC